MAATVMKPSISSELAAKVIAAAESKAVTMGVPMVIAVCDESGILKEYRRMDGAPLLSVEIAIDKAWSAVSFGVPTHGLHDFVKDDAPLALGIPKVARLILFGGGYPIRIEGALVGAIGVSGGHYNQDMEVAEAGLTAL